MKKKYNRKLILICLNQASSKHLTRYDYSIPSTHTHTHTCCDAFQGGKQTKFDKLFWFMAID